MSLELPASARSATGGSSKLAQLLRLCVDRQYRKSHRMFRRFPQISYRYLLDVGAHEGSFTTRALHYWRPERIWLVEADATLADALRTNFQAHPQCKVIQVAVAETSGTAEFRIHPGRASSSLLPIAPVSRQIFSVPLREAETVIVPTVSLDELFQREEISRLGLMKVDIQGAERMLIRGGQQALRRTRLIYIEVVFEQIYEGCALFEEIHRLLMATGFKIRLLQESRFSPQGTLIYANALYGREGLLEV